jgi:hypothetical protein
VKQYYKNILAQILKGEQPDIMEMINSRFEDGYEFEGQTIYSFESLRIHEAIAFLEENWGYLQPFLQKHRTLDKTRIWKEF